MTDGEYFQFIQTANNLWPSVRPINGAQSKAWRTALNDLDAEKVRQTITRCAEKYKWRPTIEQFMLAYASQHQTGVEQENARQAAEDAAYERLEQERVQAVQVWQETPQIERERICEAWRKSVKVHKLGHVVPYPTEKFAIALVFTHKNGRCPLDQWM